MFTTMDEWKNMTPVEQRQHMYELKNDPYYQKNQTLMMYELALRNISDKNSVEEYNQILQSPELVESIKKSKNSWIHSKTEMEMVDESIIHEKNKKEWDKQLHSIKKEIELWDNIKLVTPQNKPCFEDLHQFPFSTIVTSGIISTTSIIPNKKKWFCFGKSSTTIVQDTEVTILTTNDQHYPLVRIEWDGKHRKSMIADYIAVMLDEKKDTSVFEKLVKEKKISHFEMCIPQIRLYKLYFDTMSIHTMPNIIEECKKYGLEGHPDIFRSLC